MSLKLSLALMAMSIPVMAQSAVVTVDPSTSLAWPVGSSFEPGEVGATIDPLGPFSGIPIEFRGYTQGGSQVSLNGGACGNSDPCLVFDYHLSFPSTAAITSIAVTGDAFNGATFQLLDSTNAVITSAMVNSGNVGHPVTYTISTPGAVGTSFTLKLFDVSTYWTFVSNISIAAAIDVTSQVSMTTEPFSANRNNRDPYWCTIINLANNALAPDRTTRGTTIAGPIEVVLTNLSSNATLVSPAGTLAGWPYVVVQPSALPEGGQASAQLCFLNPSGAPITFVPKVFSGALL